MTSNQLFSGNNTMDNIKLKVNSLMTLLAELQEPSHNYKFDPSICNDIYMYIKNVETDCQKILTSNKYNMYPNIHNSFDRMNISKSIQTVNNVDDYNGKFQKFEDEIDFHVDKVIKSIYQTADILTIHHKEILQLDKQTDSIYQKLNSEKEMINNSIDKFNNTNMEKEFWKWRERLKQKNETNVSFTKEALKLKSNYQQKMLMVKKNIMNIIESLSNNLLLRTECLKLEIHIIWEGNTILKMYKRINTLIEDNKQKCNNYNDIEFQTRTVHKQINNDLIDNIMCINSKMKMKIFNQIQKHDDAKKMIEQKFKQMCTLDNNLSDVGGLLVKSQEYLKILDSKLEKNEKNIINKRQQIEDEHNKIKNLKIDLDIKQTSILDNQNLIKEKQSQLKDIELQCEKESKEFEKMKLQRHKNQIKMELMQSVMKHHEKETKEKIQFYHNNIIRPLELKLQKCVTLIEHEKMRNIEIEANVMEITPEFEIEMNNFKLQTRQLDKSLHNQYGLIKKFQDDFRNNELNVLRELDKSTTKIFNFMNIFETYIQYNTIMAKNNEIKQKNASLECELFQKQYELEKKKEKKVKAEKEENQLKAQLDTLKQSIRQQAAYNKVLGHKYNNELNKKNQIHKPI